MRKILASLIAVVLLLTTVFSFASCSIADAVDGVDILLGASRDAKDLVGTEGEAPEFGYTAAYEVPEELIPVLTEEDPKPATAGLNFILDKSGKAYNVLNYSNKGLPLNDDGSEAVLAEDVYVPFSYQGLPVIGICHGAFSFTNIKSLDLPETLIFISEKAFLASSIPAIDIPASVRSIAVDAFIDCNKLSAMTVESGNERYRVEGNYLMDGTVLYRGFGNGTIGADVTEIAPNAFRGCDALTEVTVPATVAKIGNGAFSNCPNLATAVIESEITELPDTCFDGDSALVSLTFPTSVKIIGYAACRGTGFTTYDLPNNVEKLESCAFADCANLTTFNFSTETANAPSLTFIGGSAFENCDLISSIVFPEGLITINPYAFKSCDALKNVTFSSTVATLGSGAFYECRSLEPIVFPLSINYIGAYAFYGVNAAFHVTFMTTYVPNKAMGGWNYRDVENAMESGKIAPNPIKINHTVQPRT